MTRKDKIDKIRQHLADKWPYVAAGNADVSIYINNNGEPIYDIDGLMLSRLEWYALLGEAHDLWIQKMKG